MRTRSTRSAIPRCLSGPARRMASPPSTLPLTSTNRPRRQTEQKSTSMKIADVRANAFAMPLNDPAYPRPPYKFYNREFVVITYRTDPERLRAVVPEPLEVIGDTVAYEFIRMPDSTGFGDYTETGQVIPVRFTTASGEVQEGGYVHAMYLDDNSPIAGGREIWGFPKKLASPKLCHEQETLVGTLHYGSVLCVTATMGYK